MKRVLLVLLAVNLLCFNMAWAEEFYGRVRLAAAQNILTGKSGRLTNTLQGNGRKK